MRTPIVLTLSTALIVGILTGCTPTDPLAAEIATFTALDADGVSALSGEAQQLADELLMDAAGRPGEPFPISQPEALGGPGLSAATVIPDLTESVAFTTISRILIEKLGDARTTDEPIEGALPEGGALSYSYTVRDGRMVGTTTQAQTLSSGAVSGEARIVTQFDVAACPAADGTITANIGYQTKATFTGSDGQDTGERWGALDFSLSATGKVGDDAMLTTVDLNSSAEITGGGALNGGSGGREGINFASSWSYQLAYTGGEPGKLDPRGLPTITRASSAVGLAAKAQLLRSTAGLTYSMATNVFLIAQEHWRSGACVRLGLAADADLPTVEKSSTTSLTLTPIAKVDNQPTGGTITAVRDSGAGTIDSTDPRPAPAEYRYVAPNVDDTTLVTFTATSRRGIGMLTQKFQTTIPGWVIHETINGIETYGQKCESLSGEWFISSSGGGWYQASTTAQIDAVAGTGSYGISGVADGYGFSGGGLVTLETLPDGTLMMHFLPGEANYLGNGDFVVREDDEICN